MSANGERWRRWLPAVSMLLVSLIGYIDRNTLALLAPAILHETGLNGAQYGFIILACCAALTLAFAAVPWLPNVAAVMLGMFLAMFAAAGFIVLSVAYATDVYSADHAGLIAGAGAGSWSAAVAVTMPLFGHLFDLHRYSAAFWIAAGIGMAGYLGWLALGKVGHALACPGHKDALE